MTKELAPLIAEALSPRNAAIAFEACGAAQHVTTALYDAWVGGPIENDNGRAYEPAVIENYSTIWTSERKTAGSARSTMQPWHISQDLPMLVEVLQARALLRDALECTREQLDAIEALAALCQRLERAT
jgi:hypothetical protein